MHRICLLLFFLLLPLAAGCDKPADSTETGESNVSENVPAESSSSTDNALAPEDVDLKIVNGDAYRRAVAKHKGKVVLVDYWATWCAPCKENFPHIVELHKKHADEGLAVISVVFNEPDEENEQLARMFLAQQSATFENLLSKDGVGIAAADDFEFDGGVPLYKLFDRTGKLRYQFSQFPDDLENGQPLEKIDERVKELLAEMPEA